MKSIVHKRYRCWHEYCQVQPAQAGFTIIEVLIALVVFSVSFLGYYSLHLQSVTGNASANRLTSAAVWGSDQIEQLIALKYNDSQLTDRTGDGLNGLNNTGSAADRSKSSIDGLYTISWNVVTNYPLRNVTYIRVIVSKTAGMGANAEPMTYDHYKCFTN